MKKTLISIGLIMMTALFSNTYANFDASRNYSSNEIKLMTRSCERGYLKDCNTIGFIYSIYSKDKDLSKAIEPYTKACNGGIMDSCMYLGGLYGFGVEGVQQDISKADRLMRKACNGGVKYACETLEKRPYDK